MGKVFCSYRQKDRDALRVVVDKLGKRLNDYVFFDERTESDDVKALLKEVEQCNVFLLFVTQNTLDPARIFSESDWVHQEIALALVREKPIVPVFYAQPPPTRASLPDDIADLADKIGLHCDATVSDAFADALANKCVAVSNHSLSRKAAPQADDAAAMQRVMLLMQEREKLLKQKGYLLADQEPSGGSGMNILYLLIALVMVTICGFALNPTLGIIVLIGAVIGGAALAIMNDQSGDQDQRRVSIARLDERIRDLEAQIRKGKTSHS